LSEFRWLAGVLVGVSFCASCGRGGSASPEPLFVRVPPESSGVTFVNELPDDTAFNILNYLYYYNGGGVAAGDVNGDGLPDLYFTSNLGTGRLYLNRGGYRFEDVTGRAGVGGPTGWSSGVTMADVDGDGHLDIYVSTVSYRGLRGRNALYMNRGDGTFREEAARWGLDHQGYGTQAAFFDYDGDGDLDVYLLNSSVHDERGPSASPQREPRHPRAGDKLLRNEGSRFVDVSARAGIHGGVEGYGLGVVASDLDSDGCVDLYVANDFQENDFLYFNNCDGTFTESVTSAMPHTSRFAMGVDAADVNNDGRPDVAVMDMLPDREDVLKTSANGESWELAQLRLKAGYHAQQGRNTLQLNRGARRFSDVAYLAGVHATDWSWAPLFADLDNDGLKDLFITSGIWRRPNDLDYVELVGGAAMQASLARGADSTTLRLARRMPHVPLPNKAFRNGGDLTFTDMAARWGLGEPGFSNGAVYVDLDNSGALDLVVNHVNAPAAIYRNRSRELNGHHFLSVRLRGAGKNTAGVGARVTAFAGGRLQLLEQTPTRGFQSSVDPTLHFGLGAATRVDSLLVVWPDRRYQVVRDLAADRLVVVAQDSARGRFDQRPDAARPLFVDVSDRAGLDVVHRENDFVDFQREPLIPHMLSREGPALAVGDVNGDSLDDVFIGGAKWEAGRLYVQRNGRFGATSQPALAADSLAEDVDAEFFDADGDGDLDLYVVSAGNEFSERDDEALFDRLYLNDGRGGLRRAPEAIPPLADNGSCVAPSDFDGDGDVDLFVGSRVVARRYGWTPTSRLLRNDGRGRFTDVTAELAPELAEAGMVTDAAWTDVDGDAKPELVVVGEWMPVRVFGWSGSRFVERTRDAGLEGTNGWWNSVTAADLNGDGRADLVLGNLGLNSFLRASQGSPARLTVHDFDGNGTLEQILTTVRGGGAYPVASRDELLRAIPTLRERFPTYASFGAKRLEDLFPRRVLGRARTLEVTTFASMVALNEGGRFRLVPLPAEAQFAPLYAALAGDFDGDRRADVLAGGNFLGTPPLLGAYDASYGIVLRGAGPGDGSFVAMDPAASGVLVEGEVRDMKTARTATGPVVIVARNNAGPKVLRPLHPTIP